MKKVLIITGLTLVALLLIVAFAVSPIAEKYIENNSKELIGRKIEMENLSVNIFTGRLKIDDCTLYESDDQTPFFSFDKFDVNLQMFGLLFSKINVEHVMLSEANVTIIQNGDTFNFDDIVERFASDSTEEESESDWKIVINDIHLDHSYLFYQDKSIGSEFRLKDISIVIPGIDLSDLNADMGLQLAFLNGGKLDTNIKYDTEKSIYDLTLNIQNFQVSPILPYLQQSLNVDSLGGNFSSKLDIKGSTNHLLEFDANGTLTVNNLKLKDSQDKNIFAVDSAFIDINHIDLTHERIELNKVFINGVSSYYEINKDQTDNFTLLVKEDTVSAETQVDTVSESSNFNCVIKNLIVENSQFNYIDNTLPRVFDYTLSEISVSAENFDLNGKNNVTASALLQNTGKLKIKWIGNIDDFSNQNISVNLNNLDLQPLTPYSLAIFGNPINKGHLSIQSQNVIFNNMLKGSNKISLYNTQIGDKDKTVKAEYNLPLKMGIYVLTDKNGKAEIDLPVSGNIDSPDFSYRKIILNALGNVLIKVASSPFYALKSDGELENVYFTATSTEFTDEEYSHFAQLASILREKPELKLYLTQDLLYSNALTEYCVVELKKNMAIQDTTNFVNEYNANDLLVKEQYCAIPTKSQEVTDFADKLLEKKGIKNSNKYSNEQKAVLIYENDMRPAILKDMNWRNTILHSYLTKQCSVADSSLSISSNLIENDTIKNFRDNYRVTWKIGE